MDIASIIGLIGAVGMILGAMISGAAVGPFIDVPSLLIVIWWNLLCRYVHRTIANIFLEVLL